MTQKRSLTAAAILLLWVSTVTAGVAKNENELRNALKTAKPGDIIELQPKTYTGLFKATTKGTRSEPITLQGPKNAILDGGRGLHSGYVLHLDNADYWIFKGFTLRNGQKGVMLDYSNFCVLDNITVTHIGMEGVHFRKYSSDNVIKNSKITDTGAVRPGFGEGVYVGSSKSNWDKLTNGQIDCVIVTRSSITRLGLTFEGKMWILKKGQKMARFLVTRSMVTGCRTHILIKVGSI